MKRKAKSFQSVLIANRGEIACRIAAACKVLGLESIAVFSEADREALHVRSCDRSVEIGAGPASESYLSIEKLIEVARQSGAEAVHPGYGFLSERAEFARAVEKAGLVWVGPQPDVIDWMGNKIAAKRAAEKAKVPTLAWALLRDGWTPKELTAAAKKVGFPLLLKAAAGGGGRGMRLVDSEKTLLESAESAAREAEGAFGSGEVFLEAYCGRARHVEVQILGDSTGDVRCFGERDCSVQRRHQKVIEEAPAPDLSEKSRKGLWAAAVSLAKSVKYRNAGTCEFLVDEKGRFFFLEMNTRLQVEHPVTELVWGVDLAVLQLRVARGEALKDLLPEELQPRGHSIEARVYAENPAKGFLPSPGRLREVKIPQGPFVRVDTGYESGDEVPIFYDAMLAKVIVWGQDRDQARLRLRDALRVTRFVGVAWNGHYLCDILEHPTFSSARMTTGFLKEEFSNWAGSVTSPETSPVTVEHAKPARQESPWDYFNREGGGARSNAFAPRASSLQHDSLEQTEEEDSGAPLKSDYPGKVLKILAAPGQAVEKGQAVVVCESMKMEFSYSAPSARIVKSVCVTPGQIIAAGATLVEWEEPTS